MVEFNEALEIILSVSKKLKPEKVKLKDALGRTLAEDTFYDVALPPFNKSAMDGFACRRQDIGHVLEIVEVICAGKKPEKTIGENQAAKIMTGAVVPNGANCVVMKEYSAEDDGKVSFIIAKSKSNICYKGEDVKVGDLALPKNTILTARHIPVLAGAGVTEPLVACQPKVSVFATGSELVEPNEKPLSFQIRNSNSSQTIAQLDEMGVKAQYGGIIKDDFLETAEKIGGAFENSDVVILSGGVSEGDFDFIPSVIKKLGFEILLTRIAVQPGKPIIFARNGNKYCFGLAGNPVSSFMQFELYIKPFLYKLQGFEYTPKIVKATMANNFKRKKSDRLMFVPAYLSAGNNVTSVEFHGSAHINALINSNSLILMPIGTTEINKGETVDVRCL